MANYHDVMTVLDPALEDKPCPIGTGNWVEGQNKYHSQAVGETIVVWSMTRPTPEPVPEEDWPIHPTTEEPYDPNAGFDPNGWKIEIVATPERAEYIANWVQDRLQQLSPVEDDDTVGPYPVTLSDVEPILEGITIDE